MIGWEKNAAGAAEGRIFMSIARLNAIEAVTNYSADAPGWDCAKEAPSRVFGQNVFGDMEMKARLSEAAYKAVRKTIDGGAPFDASVADEVAKAMKEWAMERGASHYAHVFYPLTGLTAEKHDAFLKPDGKGGAISEFSGKQLIVGESDASSFPSGGIRATFEARGYTAWDATSPAYLLENPNGLTLCIPTAFCSWTGEALDKKTPLMRSLRAVDEAGRRVLRALGEKSPGKVSVQAGCEQEYFLVDRNFFFARPDLISSGRTVFGAKPPKGQEQEDQYFGAIPDRVLAFMTDVEHELYKLGVPVKTRHNEVAPGQYELAPVHEEANVAADHQYLTMTILQRVAARYGMSCLLHEKPFAGINGSGKHLNWSVGTEGRNLLEPGAHPADNPAFLVFATAVLAAVDRHADLLRMSVAYAGNDLRLGGNEAPPRVISVFLGDRLTAALDGIGKAGAEEGDAGETMRVGGVETLPAFRKDEGDRNRTSTMAFTGNKFEFRAVGSSQSVAGPMTMLNAAVAESLEEWAARLEGAEDVRAAVRAGVAEIMAKHGRVVFNGDGYGAEWEAEAARRGLPNLKDTVEAIEAAGREGAGDVLAATGVLSRREFEARREIYLEKYVHDVVIEGRLSFEIAKTKIFPAAMEYQGRLAATAVSLRQLGKEFCTTVLDEVSGLLAEFQPRMERLRAALDREPGSGTVTERARHCAREIVPAMEAVREVADELEGIVADDLWPLPTYQEMLFIK